METNKNTNGSLTAIVCNCVNAPNPERFGLLVDPYVNAEFQGLF